MPLDPSLCQSLLQLPLPIAPPVLCQSVIVYVILSAVSFLFHALLLLIDWSVSAEHPVGHTVALNATVTVTAVCALCGVAECIPTDLLGLPCPVLSAYHITSAPAPFLCINYIPHPCLPSLLLSLSSD